MVEEDGGYYEKPEAYPGPFKPIPKLEPTVEGGGDSKYNAKPGLLPDHNAAGGQKEWPFEIEGEGSKYPHAAGG